MEDKSSFEAVPVRSKPIDREQALLEARRQAAAAVVSAQPIICGVRFMDQAAEEVLRGILQTFDGNEALVISGPANRLPAGLAPMAEFEKLKLYGHISNYSLTDADAWEATLTPSALSYFQDKENAFRRDSDVQQAQIQFGSIAKGGRVPGEVQAASLSVANALSRLEASVREAGREEVEELLPLLEEVRELLENLQNSRHVPKSKHLFEKLSDQFEKNGWFYADVVELLGSAVMELLRG